MLVLKFNDGLTQLIHCNPKRIFDLIDYVRYTIPSRARKSFDQCSNLQGVGGLCFFPMG